MPTDYAVAPRVRARLMGVLLVGLGVLVCLMTVVVSLLRLPVDVLSVVVILVVVAVFGGGYVLTRRTYLLRAGEDGYRVRHVRGVGVPAARWSDVEDVVTAEVAGARCVVLRLRDGGTTTVPVDLLAVGTEQFVDELRERLDRGHGRRGRARRTRR